MLLWSMIAWHTLGTDSTDTGFTVISIDSYIYPTIMHGGKKLYYSLTSVAAATVNLSMYKIKPGEIIKGWAQWFST